MLNHSGLDLTEIIEIIADQEATEALEHLDDYTGDFVEELRLKFKLFLKERVTKQVVLYDFSQIQSDIDGCYTQNLKPVVFNLLHLINEFLAKYRVDIIFTEEDKVKYARVPKDECETVALELLDRFLKHKSSKVPLAAQYIKRFNIIFFEKLNEETSGHQIVEEENFTDEEDNFTDEEDNFTD